MRAGVAWWLAAACTVAPVDKADDDTDPPEGRDDSDAFAPPPVSETAEPADRDGDGVPDADDTCPDLADDQADLDGDGVGDACDPDRDGDLVPDELDRWPDDGTFPGVASGELVYAHSATELYVLQLRATGEKLDRIGAFTFDVPPPDTITGHEVTDLAVDRVGQLYAVTFDELFICHALTAECRRIGVLPSRTNGLTFVPEATQDALLGLSEQQVFELDVSSSVVLSRPRGRLEPGCSGTCAKASGDAFSIEGVGTYATVYGYDGYTFFDQLVEIDPATGAITREVMRFTGANNLSGPASFRDIWGLAAWNDGYFYGFAETGEILKIDVQAKRFEVLADAGVAWWGAGVRTIIPSTP